MKRCPTCERDMPTAAFSRCARSRDGLMGVCRECNRAKVRAWKAANPEKVAAARARRREKRKAYKARRVGIERAHARASHRRHREEYNRRRRARYAIDGDAVRARNRAARPLRRHGRRVAEQRYDDVLRRDPCSYCGEPWQETDHIDPVSKGGSALWDNLTSACRRCNRRKRDRSLLTFLLEPAHG